MNATKFVVLLIFVGVVCANVGAGKLEKVSKETKLGISVPNTATTNGLGAELDVSGGTFAFNSENSSASAAAGPSGPSADGTASANKRTFGSINAQGPNSRGSSDSYTYGGTGAVAEASPDGASADEYAYEGGSSDVSGVTPTP